MRIEKSLPQSSTGCWTALALPSSRCARRDQRPPPPGLRDLRSFFDDLPGGVEIALATRDLAYADAGSLEFLSAFSPLSMLRRLRTQFSTLSQPV